MATGSQLSKSILAALALSLVAAPAVADVKAVIGDSDLPNNVASGGSVTTGSSAPATATVSRSARRGSCKRHRMFLCTARRPMP